MRVAKTREHFRNERRKKVLKMKVTADSTRNSRSKLRIRPRCLKLFFLIFKFSRFQLAFLSLVHSLSLVLSHSFSLCSLLLFTRSKMVELLYKMKITAVGRIIYKEYISFFSNDIILSISDYFARNNK